jgi:protein-S-isoprenylcysteine O-methyltransferase Ste14
MDGKLFAQAVVKFLLGIMLTAILLFISAGTVDFGNAWLFMGLLFIPMSIAGIVLMRKNPELLRKRLKAKEKEPKQKTIILLGGLMFLCGFIIAGLDHRYGWMALPKWIVIASSFVFLLSYILYAEVLRENAYLSRTIEIQEDQKIIDTGLYGIVRHPMYSATIFLFLAIPLILGSLFSFFIFLTYPVIIVKRIKNEEKVLEEGLPGYVDYKKRVKYRILPFVW